MTGVTSVVRNPGSLVLLHGSSLFGQTAAEPPHQTTKFQYFNPEILHPASLRSPMRQRVCSLEIFGQIFFIPTSHKTKQKKTVALRQNWSANIPQSALRVVCWWGDEPECRRPNSQPVLCQPVRSSSPISESASALCLPAVADCLFPPLHPEASCGRKKNKHHRRRTKHNSAKPSVSLRPSFFKEARGANLAGASLCIFHWWGLALLRSNKLALSCLGLRDLVELHV